LRYRKIPSSSRLQSRVVDVQFGKISRTDAIASVSEELRARAARRHYDIDEKFRNENGISLQMAHLEYGLTDGETGWEPAYRWQEQILDIYYNEPEIYKKLLNRARK
ncbi:hypothetical protein, partial [Mitsuokella jalaludinii]